MPVRWERGCQHRRNQSKVRTRATESWLALKGLCLPTGREVSLEETRIYQRKSPGAALVEGQLEALELDQHLVAAVEWQGEGVIVAGDREARGVSQSIPLEQVAKAALGRPNVAVQGQAAKPVGCDDARLDLGTRHLRAPRENQRGNFRFSPLECACWARDAPGFGDQRPGLERGTAYGESVWPLDPRGLTLPLLGVGRASGSA